MEALPFAAFSVHLPYDDVVASPVRRSRTIAASRGTDIPSAGNNDEPHTAARQQSGGDLIPPSRDALQHMSDAELSTLIKNRLRYAATKFNGDYLQAIREAQVNLIYPRPTPESLFAQRPMLPCASRRTANARWRLAGEYALTVSQGHRVSIAAKTLALENSPNSDKQLEGATVRALQPEIIRVNRKYKHYYPTSGDITEADAETRFAIIETTRKSKGKFLQTGTSLQLPRVNRDRKPVILMAPEYLNSSERNVAEKCVAVVRSAPELVAAHDLLKSAYADRQAVSQLIRNAFVKVGAAPPGLLRKTPSDAA